MAKPVDPTFFNGPFETPLPEADRFGDQRAAHFAQERRMSGDLPDQPDGLPVQPTPGNPVPWKNLSTRR